MLFLFVKRAHWSEFIQPFIIYNVRYDVVFFIYSEEKRINRNIIGLKLNAIKAVASISWLVNFIIAMRKSVWGVFHWNGVDHKIIKSTQLIIWYLNIFQYFWPVKLVKR